MSCLYITENGSKVSTRGGHFIVECQDGSERLVPKETLESIVIFGNVYLTVPCIKECMERGISVSMFSTKGRYLYSQDHITQFLSPHIHTGDANQEQCHSTELIYLLL